MNQVFLSKTFEFQLNRLYKYTCWTSDRHTRFLLGYRNMHDRNQLKLESHSILTKKSFCPAIGGAGPPCLRQWGPVRLGAQGPDAGKDGHVHPTFARGRSWNWFRSDEFYRGRGRGESFRFQTPVIGPRCALAVSVHPTYVDLATPLGLPVYMHYTRALEPTRIAVRTRGFILEWQGKCTGHAFLLCTAHVQQSIAGRRGDRFLQLGRVQFNTVWGLGIVTYLSLNSISYNFLKV